VLNSISGSALLVEIEKPATFEPFKVSREDRYHSLLGGLDGNSPAKVEAALTTPLASLLSNDASFTTEMRGFVESQNTYPFKMPPTDEEPYGEHLSAKDAIPILVAEAAERRAQGNMSDYIPSQIVQYMAHTIGHAEVNSGISPVLDICVLYASLDSFANTANPEQLAVVSDIKSFVERSFVGRVAKAFDENVVKNNLPDDCRDGYGTNIANTLPTTSHSISSFLNLTNGINSTLSLWLAKEVCGGEYLCSAYDKLSPKFAEKLKQLDNRITSDLATALSIATTEDSPDRYRPGVNMDREDHGLFIDYCERKGFATALLTFDSELDHLLKR
jgi:hypothetical protein